MSKEKDIFDRLMTLPFLRIFNPLYRKHKEVLLYLFFGGLTMVVSIFSYWLCSEPLGMGVLFGNVVSWIAAVSFAYVTNCIWVFEQQAHGWRALFKQVFRFFSGRVATLGVEELILWVFIQQLHCPNMAVKVIAQVVVVVLNYFISKFLVFRKTRM